MINNEKIDLKQITGNGKYVIECNLGETLNKINIKFEMQEKSCILNFHIVKYLQKSREKNI